MPPPIRSSAAPPTNNRIGDRRNPCRRLYLLITAKNNVVQSVGAFRSPTAPKHGICVSSVVTCGGDHLGAGLSLHGLPDARPGVAYGLAIALATALAPPSIMDGARWQSLLAVCSAGDSCLPRDGTTDRRHCHSCETLARPDDACATRVMRRIYSAQSLARRRD